MNCIIHIGGREALPVRAIPFVTGWQSYSPDAVAEGLAHRLESGKFEGLTAYHIASDGSISAMLPKEWDGPARALAALSEKLDEMGGDSYPLWREQSISELPSHCFVWRDEFEKNVTGWWRTLHLVGERPGDKELNFAPRIPPNLEVAVFEGMPKLIPIELPKDRGHVSDALAVLNQAAHHWWANADKRDSSTHPKNADVAAWLTNRGMSKSLANHAAAIIRPAWAHAGRKPDA